MYVGLAGLTLLLGVTGAAAQSDDCRARCQQWGAPCTAACADAPVPDECKANCKKMQQQCLSDCAGTSKRDHDGFGTICEGTT